MVQPLKIMGFVAGVLAMALAGPVAARADQATTPSDIGHARLDSDHGGTPPIIIKDPIIVKDPKPKK